MLTSEQQIFEQIKKAKNILITFPQDWNGDSISSALAFFLFLKKLDKNVEIAADSYIKNRAIQQEPNKLYSFLPSIHEIKNTINNLRKFIISLDITNTKVDQIKYKVEENVLNFIVSPKKGFFTPDDISSRSGEFKYDLVITLDSPDLESLGKIYDNDTEFFYNTPIINIDHHSDNEEFGQINLIELTAVSTSEILFSLFDAYSRDIINEDIATCLLTGIICKTKSFKTSNITPRTLLTTSQLISMGARREEIVNRLYRSRNLNVLKLWGRVLAKLASTLENKLIWSTLIQEDFTKTNSNEESLIDVIDELIINIPQAKVIVIIYEMPPQVNKEEQTASPITNIIVYSIKNIDSIDLIKELNPIGTKRIAQAKLEKGVQTSEKEVIELIKIKLEKLSL
ncbi:MAG: DHH family phosphoesterase [Patescibacteria group bacterium]